MSDSVFSIHPRNPRCFQYRGKLFEILTSAEHYGAVLNADFDYDIYLREMQRTGQNMTRVFTLAPVSIRVLFLGFLPRWRFSEQIV